MRPTICEICAESFIIELQTQVLKNNVERVYFTCPHCNIEYTSYYTNVLIKKKQGKIKQLEEKCLAIREQNPKQAGKLFKQIQKLKKEVDKDLENLRKRMEAPTK